MSSLPTISQDYWVQAEYNGNRLFDQLFPGLPTLVDPQCLIEIMGFLSETRVNPQILPRVIRGVNNILLGTGKGQVIVHVNGESMNVSVRETDEQIKTNV